MLAPAWSILLLFLLGVASPSPQVFSFWCWALKPFLVRNASTTDARNEDTALEFWRITAALAGSTQLSTSRGGMLMFSTYTGFFSAFLGERLMAFVSLSTIDRMNNDLSPGRTRLRLRQLHVFVQCLPDGEVRT